MDDRTRSPAPIVCVPALLAAGANLALLLAYAGRYGYHRDELYFLSSARRLAWGFVDQPPLTPALQLSGNDRRANVARRVVIPVHGRSVVEEAPIPGQTAPGRRRAILGEP